MHIRLIAFNCRYSHSCLALFYVRQELARHLPSCSCTIEQFTINDPYYETLLRISGEEADALFFSVYIWNATYLCRLLTDLHRLLPNLPLVLGGPQAAELRATLTFRPTVVHHEIEGVAPDFYRDLRAGVLGSDYQSLPVKLFSSPYIQEDFTRQLKNRNIYYESSRGCPFFCAYCLSSLDRGLRVKDLSQVKEELLAILDHRPTMIRFVDRTFNADPSRTLTLWKFLAAQADRGTSFHFEIAPDLFTEALFQFLEGVPEGLFQFEIGIQSTNRETLVAVNRKMDLTRSLATIRRLKEIGTVHLHVDLILGLPLETAESFAQGVRDVLKTEPHYLQMGLLKVLPGTEIAKRVTAYGIIASQAPPYQVLATQWLDHPTLARLYWLGECVEAFYNKGYFRTFFSYLIHDNKDLYLFFDQLVSACLKREFFSLAKTQAFMNDILYQFVASRPDAGLCHELLTFDWLLCGHRFLPEIFHQDINAYRDLLWHQAPAEIPALYTAKERNMFFKRGIFYKFSARVLSLRPQLACPADVSLGFFKDHDQAKTTVMVIGKPYPMSS